MSLKYSSFLCLADPRVSQVGDAVVWRWAGVIRSDARVGQASTWMALMPPTTQTDRVLTKLGPSSDTSTRPSLR